MYGRKIYAYVSYNLNVHNHMAEDLTEGVFLKVLENIGSYRVTGVPFSAWLYRIAHNHVIDYLRTLPKQQTHSLDDSIVSYTLQAPEAEAALQRCLDREGLREALEGLTAEQRQVVVLRFLQDQSVAQTAVVMGKGEDAIKKLQTRALQSLRRNLMRESYASST